MQYSILDGLEWDDDAEARYIVREFPGGLTRESVAWYLGITVDEVEQEEESALRKFWRGLRDLDGWQ